MLFIQDERSRPRPLSQADQVRSLSIILQEEFGSPFRFYHVATGREAVGAAPEDPAPAQAEPPENWDALREVAADGRASVEAVPGGRFRLVFPVPEGESPSLVAVGSVAALVPAGSAAAEQARLGKWLLSVQDRVRLSITHRTRRREDASREGQNALGWDTVMALEQLMSSQRIHNDPSRERQRALRLAAEVLRVQTVVWVPSQVNDTILIEGERLLSAWDCNQLAGLVAQAPGWEKSGVVMVNNVAEGNWGGRFPRIANLMAMPLGDKAPAGWLIALNKKAGADPAAPDAEPFRRSDAGVLAAFTAGLGMQIRSTQRYHQLKVLLVGLTRSLTAAIDAKDSYTFGHSERVARVAVELGRELGLAEDEVSDIYLGGLLHDIGKIGVSDAVLGKRGPLTPDEVEHVRQHVKIGYRILAGLRAISHLLPGVLYHHEQIDGKGYPEGLRGEAIPFIARIIAVADGFDAMSTSRPYRDALPPEKVDRIMKEGIGVQWDARVVEAFFRCRAKIHAVRQKGVGESLCTALDGAIRNGRAIEELTGSGSGLRSELDLASVEAAPREA